AILIGAGTVAAAASWIADDVGIAVVRCGRDTPTPTLPTCGMAGSWQRASEAVASCWHLTSEAVASGSGQRQRSGRGSGHEGGDDGRGRRDDGHGRDARLAAGGLCTLCSGPWAASMNGLDPLIQALLKTETKTASFGRFDGRMSSEKKRSVPLL
ncbi:hypothetical protein ACLOJK_027032, partial [Asimina triloba]